MKYTDSFIPSFQANCKAGCERMDSNYGTGLRDLHPQVSLLNPPEENAEYKVNICILIEMDNVVYSRLSYC